jgi:hypothetical protein
MPEETIGLMSAVETASGRWHRRKNKETQESYYLFDKDDDDDLKQGHFTDLMLLKSVGFSANLTGNNPQISDPLMSEMIKAIAIYEINIKIVSGVISSLGNVINRFG